MPREPTGLKLSVSLVLTTATAAAIAGSVLLRRRPLTAIGLLIAASAAVALARNSPTVSLAHYVAVAVALGFIVATRNRPIRIAALALTLAVIPGYARVRMAVGAPAGGPPGWEVYVLTAVVAWLAGDSVRRARNYAERLRAHAVAEAVTAERLRISRELHDLVAHSMGIITLQAGAAARVIDTQPQRAREALFEVESAGRETLAGLRRMLGPLRQAGAGQAGAGQGYQPGSMPGLAGIGRLAAATTAAGVHVDVQWRGERRPLPPDFELAVYRIVQESVTNVVRHAGTRSCQVLIADDGEAVSIEVADLAGSMRPDVVVMDIRMPGMDGIEATRRIMAGHHPGSQARVVVLTTFDDDEYVYAALRAGASGFLVKDMALEEILAAVRTVAAGDALIAPAVTRRLIEEFARRPEPVPAPAPARGQRAVGGITERERDVLTLIGRGLSNTEIAADLTLSIATVKTYVTRLLTKLDARDRVQLVIIAYDAGLVAPAR